MLFILAPSSSKVHCQKSVEKVGRLEVGLVLDGLWLSAHTGLCPPVTWIPSILERQQGGNVCG
jgi:hypothetical protein